MLKVFQAGLLLKAALAAILAACLSHGAAEAATTTATFQSQITIVADCQIPTTNTLNFGSNGALLANVDATTTFSVQCTNTTPYDIGLNQGTTAGGTTATRLMTSGSATVSYQMFSDAARTVNWGNTVGTDTVAATGNGAAQSYTIFGRVPAQTTPAPGLYTDTVTITVTF
ncbi:MAG: spore coat U domain-containing protein [Beijerinckiaceae bacterium]|nr:spore coat U domain-containing protein [Beijerinckiaceae bacterium]